MPGLRAPSISKPIPAPIFAVTWHTSPPLLPTHVYACSGGGGSAKTGVNNFIEVVITSPEHGETNIKIDTGNDVGVALDLFSFESSKNGDKGHKAVTLFLAVGIQDSVKVYKILVNANNDEDIYNSVKMVGSLEFERGFLTNSVAFDSLGIRIAVGGENGAVYVCGIEWDDQSEEKMDIQKEIELTGQHIKGICKVTYHPTNPKILLSSAKDGTCKVWDLSKGPDERCLDTLDCKIFDPKDLSAGKKIPKKILSPAPGQCLVKGCVFADLQGQFIFTVQSGRRGQSFLSVWKIARVPIIQGQINSPGQTQTLSNSEESQPQQPPKFKLVFQEVNRICVAEFPISAVSLSGDFSTLVLGDTNGSVMLLNTETFKKIKYWEAVHDLPVTCLAARPLPIPLAGEDKIGITVDAICSSADSKMCFLTKQRKSTLKPVRKGGRSGGGSISYYLTLIFAVIWMVFATKITHDICSNDLSLDCIIHTVWWAKKDRPGIASVPI